MTFNNQLIGNAPATSFTAASDEVSGVEYQRVKLADPREDNADPFGTATNPIHTTSAPASSGGLTIYRNIDVDETDVQVKGSAGQLYGYYIHNNSSATIFLKFYNALAANVTVGTTTPVLTLPIPAFSSANADFSHGIAFSTGITIACTGGLADSDTTALGANECIVNLFYS